MDINLKKIEWFNHAGDFSAKLNVGLPIQAIGDRAALMKSLKSINWGNFILYAKNRLSWYIKSFHAEAAKGWNDVAKQAQSRYAELEPTIIDAAQHCDVPSEILPFVKALVISYEIEQYFYDHVSKEIPRHFYKIMEIFDVGHVAVGWEGAMPKNEGYSEIDLNAGKILIW